MSVDKPRREHMPEAPMSSPQNFLISINQSIPSNVWQCVDEIRFMTPQSFSDWPPYVFMPLPLWITLLSTLVGREATDKEVVETGMALRIAGTWRVTQDIVQFDPARYAAITRAPIPPELSCHIFYQLPAWCVYVETQGMVLDETTILGFWALLDHDMDNDEDALDICYLHSRQDGGIISVRMSLAKKNVLEATEAMVQKHSVLPLLEADARQENRLHVSPEFLRESVRILIYLCTQGLPGRGTTPCRPAPVKTKRGPRLFPAQKPTVHKVE